MTNVLTDHNQYKSHENYCFKMTQIGNASSRYARPYLFSKLNLAGGKDCHETKAGVMTRSIHYLYGKDGFYKGLLSK